MFLPVGEKISPEETAARKPLRIACIGSRGLPSNYSGLERACEGLYSALAQRGHDITVYCRPECGWYPSHSYRGIRLRHVPAIRSTQLETLSHVATSLAHALRRDRYDVVHPRSRSERILETVSGEGDPDCCHGPRAGLAAGEMERNRVEGAPVRGKINGSQC